MSLSTNSRNADVQYRSRPGKAALTARVVFLEKEPGATTTISSSRFRERITVRRAEGANRAVASATSAFATLESLNGSLNVMAYSEQAFTDDELREALTPVLDSTVTENLMPGFRWVEMNPSGHISVYTPGSSYEIATSYAVFFGYPATQSLDLRARFGSTMWTQVGNRSVEVPVLDQNNKATTMGSNWAESDGLEIVMFSDPSVSIGNFFSHFRRVGKAEWDEAMAKWGPDGSLVQGPTTTEPAVGLKYPRVLSRKNSSITFAPGFMVGNAGDYGTVSFRVEGIPAGAVEAALFRLPTVLAGLAWDGSEEDTDYPFAFEGYWSKDAASLSVEFEEIDSAGIEVFKEQIRAELSYAGVERATIFEERNG